jgi:putative ABC transport system permease protein
MSGIAERMSQAEVNVRDGWTTSVFPFAVEDTSPEVRRALYVLMAAVGFLLLIGCANLANLTLARATLRSREIAVRLALGATRPRIVAQLIVESLVVSIAGAAAGLVLAEWSIKLMVAFKPEDIQRTELISINLPVLFFAAAASILTTLLFGLAPAIAISRQDLNTALKSSGGWGASGARARSRQVLIAIEVALAMVLMVGAGLMIRSFRELLAVGIGFNTERLTYTDFDLPANRYPNGASQSRFFCELIARAGTLAGASGAAVVDNPPLHAISAANFYIAGRPDPPPSQLPVSDMAHASPDYMSLIGLHLEAGRLFTEADRVIAEKDGDAPVIVNRAFVEKFLRGENPLGQRLLDGDRKRAWQIVGVISDYRPMGVENGTRPTIFWPYLKSARATLVVRSGAPINLLTAAIRDTVWSLDKDLPAAEVRPMQYYVDQWLSQRKFNTLLLGIFAALALVLGMMGVYGVLANLVASRTREIGIRVAIGASPAAIGGLVLRQSMIPVAAGAAVGLAASLLLGRFLEALLFQVHPRDPLAFAAASATILLASPLAVYLPLRRATRVSCTVALREE